MRRPSGILQACVCGLLIAMLSAVAHAQFKASIQGTVTDTAGALVAGANVTVTNKETGKSQQVVTSDQGFYRVGELPPGKYTVTVEGSGFKKQIVDDITLNAEAPLGVNVVIEPGQVTEAVTINAGEAATALQTENANIDRAITSREIQRLPQVGRDPYELARLAPGVFGAGARSSNGGASNLPNTSGPGGSSTSIFATENQVPISANGQRVSANSYQIDGVSVNSQTWGGAAVITPTQESVKEIQVSSSTYSAEDGRNSGAVIKVVSQNGTNDFHGSAFYKYDDPGLNAFNKFFIPTRVENKFRQYGGSIGGPLPFPRFGEVDPHDPFFRSGKDRLWFFFAYEGARNRSDVPYTSWIETPQYRQLVINRSPNSVTARIFQDPGIQPRVIAILPRDCNFAGIPTSRCQ